MIPAAAGAPNTTAAAPPVAEALALICARIQQRAHIHARTPYWQGWNDAANECVEAIRAEFPDAA